MAIDELAGGDFDVDVALADIADALEGLDLTQSDVPFAEEDRDDLVANLREAQPNERQLAFAAAVFQADLFPEISEC